ncbi:hypothetical protein ACIBTV_20075 [Micromonospora sp. NPDC049366]|uniref:hypothetical protein n=1 Tax=Micromonospora sp. NPDC049366 TaxID=3364271 RepID=UPI0037B0D2B9
MFSIRLARSGDAVLGSSVSLGRITADGLDEAFEAPTSEWDEAAYRASWRSELQRILDGADRAVLLTLVVDPLSANWLRGYVLYRLGNEIRIQERLFFANELDHEIDLANPSRSVPTYESVNEDGVRISEWVTSLGELRDFFEIEYGVAEGE